jgi:hypothetical protein
MEAFSALWLVVILAFFFVAPLTLWLPFYMAAKARGIERALWAIVSQLQAMRREEPDPVQELIRQKEREAQGSKAHVSLSMFGR